MGIVLPNCEDWVENNLKGVSSNQVFIKAQQTIADLGIHFGLSSQKVKEELMKIWKLSFPQMDGNAIIMTIDKSGKKQSNVFEMPDEDKIYDNSYSVRNLVIADKRKIMDDLKNQRLKASQQKNSFLLDLCSQNDETKTGRYAHPNVIPPYV
jgi:hypothetical protein